MPQCQRFFYTHRAKNQLEVYRDDQQNNDLIVNRVTAHQVSCRLRLHNLYHQYF